MTFSPRHLCLNPPTLVGWLFNRKFFIKKEIRNAKAMIPKTDDLKKYGLILKLLKEDYIILIDKIIYLCNEIKSK